MTSAPVPNSIPPFKGVRGKETNFSPRSAAEILSHEPEPMAWVWEPFIPTGSLVLLCAFMKVGKSTLIYALALAIAQGRAFLGFPTKQGAVLILALEEHPRDVRRRLERFGIRPEDPLFVHEGSLTNSPETMVTLKSFIREKQIAVVIIDTLARYWSIHDENDNAEVMQRVAPWLDLARDSGAAIILVHHERKSNGFGPGGDDGRTIRGGSALFGLVDQALLLGKCAGGDQARRALRSLGRYEETPREIVIELDGDEYRLIGTPDDVTKQAHQQAVWEAVDETPQDIPKIALKAFVTVKIAREALEALGSKVTRQGRGVKGDPWTYKRTAPDSIPSQPDPIGTGTNPPPETSRA